MCRLVIAAHYIHIPAVCFFHPQASPKDYLLPLLKTGRLAFHFFLKTVTDLRGFVIELSKRVSSAHIFEVVIRPFADQMFASIAKRFWLNALIKHEDRSACGRDLQNLQNDIKHLLSSSSSDIFSSS